MRNSPVGDAPACGGSERGIAREPDAGGVSNPVLTCDGYERTIIGTLVRRAEGELIRMTTPDKDFGQLVDENTFLYKPRG
jgi:hypothetical protein